MAKKKAKPSAKKKPVKTPAKKKGAVTRVSKAKAAKKRGGTVARKRSTTAVPSLGRPKVTGDELLFMLFKEDFHARQVFDFLRVERVKELEQYSPQQIVKLLSRPITETVDRIRRKLAEKNRCLRDDSEFAAEQKIHE